MAPTEAPVGPPPAGLAPPGAPVPPAAPPGAPAYPYHAFFGPWEPPPTATPAPPDQATTDRISLLIRHCMANGPAFLATVKERQQADPNFQFLFGGDGHAYFKWALFCATMGNQPQDHAAPMHAPPAPAVSVSAPMPPQTAYPGVMPPQPPPGPMPPAQPPPAVQTMQLPAEVETGFAQVLESLTGSKESIKAAQQWFMACGPAVAPGLCRMIAMRCCAAGTPNDKQLHCIYLANDILFKGLAARAPGGTPATDPIASAMQPMLGPMLAATFLGGNRADEVAQRLQKILDFWGERGVLEPSVTAQLSQTMRTQETPSAALAVAVAQQAAAAAAARAAAAAAAAAAAPPPPAMPPAYPPPHAPGMPGYGQPPGPPPPAAPWGPTATPVPGAPPMQYPHPGMGWQQPGQPPYAPHPHMMGMPHMGHHPMPPLHPPPDDPDWGMPPESGKIMGRDGHYRDRSGSRSPRRRRRHSSSSSSSYSSRSRSRSPGSSSDSDSSSRRRARRRERVSRFTSVPVAPNHFPAPDLARSPKRSSSPSKEPVSSFTFPPGLLPALAKRRKESGARPYEPLLPEEIEDMGLPPPPSKDDYLASRLERFYAEMKDYKSGLSRADIEDPNHSWHRNRLKLDDDADGSGGKWWRGGGRRHAGKEGGKVHADGSFSGSGNMYAGLGAHVADPSAMQTDAEPEAAGGQEGAPGSALGGLDDMYNQYRLNRSGGYHAMIMANAAKAQMAGPRRIARPLG